VRRHPDPPPAPRIRAQMDQLEKQIADLDVLGLDRWDDLDL
jgi:hypothetical protein